MLVGIDESGNFESDEYNIFTAAYIRPRKAKQIEKVFTEWEKSLNVSVKDRNEVKGYKLSNQDLANFVDSILIDNHYGKIRCLVCTMRLSENQQKAILDRQKDFAAQIITGETACRECKNGDGTNFYHGMAGWTENLSKKSYNKLELLLQCTFEAFRLAPIAAMLSRHDSELGQLKISIDHSIIEKTQVRKYWKKTLSDDFWNNSFYGKRFYIFPEWKPSHPYLKKFVKHLDGELVEFTEEAPKCIMFANSKTNFEIRIADIVATIFYRFFNNAKCEEIVEKMQKAHLLLPCNKCLEYFFDSRRTGPKPPRPPL